MIYFALFGPASVRTSVCCILHLRCEQQRSWSDCENAQADIWAYVVPIQHKHISWVERYMYIKNLSCIVSKSAFCIWENKGTDLLLGNRAAIKCLCFHYIESTIPLLS